MLGLKPKVRVGCPECDIQLKFTCFIRGENDVSWVLSAVSRTHLAEAHPPRPKLTVVPDVEETYLAA